MGRIQRDLRNEKFGKLTPIEFIPSSRANNKQVPSKWRCVCDCGNEVIVNTQLLVEGKKTGCNDCMGIKSRKKAEDLTGKKFGKWTVQYMWDKQYKSQLYRMCHCKCECGNEGDIVYHNLLKGQSTGCVQCCNVAKRKPRYNLTGLKVGELTVLDFDEKTKRWNCKCSCGNTCQKSLGYLTHPNDTIITYCGNKGNHPDYFTNRHPRLVNKTFVGQTYGELTVIQQIDDKTMENGRHFDMWRCKCSCGDVRDVYGFQLRGGTVTVCSVIKHNRMNNEPKTELIEQEDGGLQCFACGWKVPKSLIRIVKDLKFCPECGLRIDRPPKKEQ